MTVDRTILGRDMAGFRCICVSRICSLKFVSILFPLPPHHHASQPTSNMTHSSSSVGRQLPSFRRQCYHNTMNILLLLSVVAAFVPCRNRRVIGMNGSQLTSVEIVLMHHDDDVSDKIDNDVTDTDTPRHSSTKTRRQFFQQQLLASTTLIPTLASAANSDIGDGYFSLRNNNNMPYAQRQQLARQQQREQQQMADKQQKVLSNISSKKWTPFLNVNKWDSVETCLLEMLPVKNGVFRRLQELIENLEVCEGG